jgi:muconolactone delta-isomerase
MKFVVIEKAVVPRLPEPRGPELSKIVKAHYEHLKKLQDAGKILHHSFIATPGGVTIIDAKDHEELDKMLMDLPRFPYCTYKVIPVLTLEEGMRCAAYIGEEWEKAKGKK